MNLMLFSFCLRRFVSALSALNAIIITPRFLHQFVFGWGQDTLISDTRERRTGLKWLDSCQSTWLVFLYGDGRVVSSMKVPTLTVQTYSRNAPLELCNSRKSHTLKSVFRWRTIFWHSGSF